jgi:hypothetical protein
MKAALLKLVLTLSTEHQIDPALVAAIIDVESKFNVEATGAIGERGLMQLHPKYFEGDAYYDPNLNIESGIKLLKTNRKYCHLKLDFSWVICYNQGISGALRVQNPEQNIYYQKVLKAYPTYVEIFQKNKGLYVYSK